MKTEYRLHEFIRQLHNIWVSWRLESDLVYGPRKFSHEFNDLVSAIKSERSFVTWEALQAALSIFRHDLDAELVEYPASLPEYNAKLAAFRAASRQTNLPMWWLSGFMEPVIRQNANVVLREWRIECACEAFGPQARRAVASYVAW